MSRNGENKKTTTKTDNATSLLFCFYLKKKNYNNNK